MGSRCESVDVVVIGSSPLLLLEALHQSRLGHRVVVVESAHLVGGAWREMPLFGLRRVEIAPHIVMYNRVTYDYFAQDLKLNVQKMSPSPRYVWNSPLGRLWIPYALSPFIAYVSAPLHYIRNKQYRANFALIREEYFGRLGHATKLLLLWIFAGRKPSIEYPLRGTLDLVDRIEELLKATNVQVRLKTAVLSVEKTSENGIQVGCSDGVTLKAKRVIMTRHQYVPRLAVGGKPVDSLYNFNTYTSVHLLVKTAHPSRSAFVLAKRDPLINLFSDLTSYMDDVPPGRRVLTLRLPHGHQANDRATAERVVEHLRASTYLASDAELVDFNFSVYEQGRIRPEGLAAVEAAFGDSLMIFRSTNFSNSIGDRVTEWKRSAQTFARTE
jgi:phytoene dehydrogenase-like protein